MLTGLLPHICFLILATDGLLQMTRVIPRLYSSTRSKIRNLLEIICGAACLFTFLQIILFLLDTPQDAQLLAASAILIFTGLRTTTNHAIPNDGDIQGSSFFPTIVPLLLGPTWLSGVTALISLQLTISAYAIILGTSCIVVLCLLYILSHFRKQNTLLQGLQVVSGLCAVILGMQILLNNLLTIFK